MTVNVLQLQEVGDFGAQNCLPPQMFHWKTELEFSNSAAILPNRC